MARQQIAICPNTFTAVVFYNRVHNVFYFIAANTKSIAPTRDGVKNFLTIFDFF